MIFGLVLFCLISSNWVLAADSSFNVDQKLSQYLAISDVKPNILIEELRKSHPSMIAVNLEIADYLIRNHKKELMNTWSPIGVKFLAMLEWLDCATYCDPIIFLQSFISRNPSVEKLLPDTRYRLDIECEPPLAPLCWLNLVHHGSTWALIGAPNEPLQNLINAIHLGRVDEAQDYIVVYLDGSELKVLLSQRGPNSAFEVIQSTQSIVARCKRTRKNLQSVKITMRQFNE